MDQKEKASCVVYYKNRGIKYYLKWLTIHVNTTLYKSSEFISFIICLLIILVAKQILKSICITAFITLNKKSSWTFCEYKFNLDTP